MDKILFGVSTLAIGVLFFVFAAVARRPSKYDEFEEFDPIKRIRRRGQRGNAIIGGVFSVILGIGFIGSGLGDLGG